MALKVLFHDRRSSLLKVPGDHTSKITEAHIQHNLEGYTLRNVCWTEHLYSTTRMNSSSAFCNRKQNRTPKIRKRTPNRPNLRALGRRGRGTGRGEGGRNLPGACCARRRRSDRARMIRRLAAAGFSLTPPRTWNAIAVAPIARGAEARRTRMRRRRGRGGACGAAANYTDCSTRTLCLCTLSPTTRVRAWVE
jgi:hypothetical protein